MSPEADVEEKSLLARCRQLYESPEVRRKGWQPNLFWRGTAQSPYGSLRVDPLELEVLFAAILQQPSLARAELESRAPGRAGFIERSIAHGELPLLTFREAAS